MKQSKYLIFQFLSMLAAIFTFTIAEAIDFSSFLQCGANEKKITIVKTGTGTILPDEITIPNVGTIPVCVEYRGMMDFFVMPDEGNVIKSIRGCGGFMSTLIPIYKTAPVTDNCTITVEFAAKPQGAEVFLSSLEREFGYVSPGVTVQKTFSVKNIGGADLKLDNLNFAQSTTKFEIVSDMCSTKTIKPEETCSFKVNYKPNATDFDDDNATINVPYQGGQKQLLVMGKGDATHALPILKTSSNMLNFLMVPAGKEVTAKVTISNVGKEGSTFTINDITIDYPGDSSDNSTFEIRENNCANKSVTTDTTCTFTVAFKPTKPDNQSFASITIKANTAPNAEKYSIYLYGDSATNSDFIKVNTTGGQFLGMIIADNFDFESAIPNDIDSLTITQAVEFVLEANEPNGIVDVSMEFAEFPNSPVIVKQDKNGSLKHIYPKNTTTGITNVKVDGRKLSFKIKDNSDVDLDNTTKIIRDPMAMGSGEVKPFYSLTVTVIGSGSVSITPVGDNCTNTCKYDIDNGTSVALVATAGNNYQFIKWDNATGSASHCNGSNCSFRLTENSSITANFAPASTPDNNTTDNQTSTTKYTIATQAGEGGSITPNTATVDQSSTATFTITPNQGYQIDNVSGCGGTLQGNTFTTGQINANCTVSVTFKQSSNAGTNVVNGSCGANNGKTLSSKPTDNLCASGTAAAFTDNETSWTWSCVGGNGGSNATCSATKQQFSITASVNLSQAGSIKCTSANVYLGGQTTCTITHDKTEAYKFDNVSTDCKNWTLSNDNKTVTLDNVTRNCSVEARFLLISNIEKADNSSSAKVQSKQIEAQFQKVIKEKLHNVEGKVVAAESFKVDNVTESKVQIKITFKDDLPANTVFYKILKNNSIRKLADCKGVTNITQTSNMLQFTIEDNSECDLDNTTGIIEDPIAGVVQSAQDVTSSSAKCFIATAVYGSYLAPEVTLLREFRDNYLLSSALGRAFVEFYYEHSPKVAELIRQNDTLKTAVRIAFTPVVYSIKYPGLFFGTVFVALTLVAVKYSRRKKS